jgi:hypothetical protein
MTSPVVLAQRHCRLPMIHPQISSGTPGTKPTQVIISRMGPRASAGPAIA